jgi:hypothetical protein
MKKVDEEDGGGVTQAFEDEAATVRVTPGYESVTKYRDRIRYRYAMATISSDAVFPSRISPGTLGCAEKRKCR